MPSSIYHKIEQSSIDIEKTLERETVKSQQLVSTGILEFFQKVAGFKPTEYQEKLLLDQNQFIVARWSRQSGKSLSIAILCLYTALSGTDRRILILAPSFRQSRRMIRKIVSFLPRLPSVIVQGRPLKTRLEFVNGSSIESFPNSPENIRGETCHMVLFDECGYIQDAQDLYDATAYSLATTNGRFIATSTPGSRDSLFYRFCNDDDQFGNFSRHHVTYLEALEPRGPLKQDIVAKLQAQCREDPWRWQREMLAEFSEDEEAWLSYGLITSCVDGNLEYLTEEEIQSMPNLTDQHPR